MVKRITSVFVVAAAVVLLCMPTRAQRGATQPRNGEGASSTVPAQLRNYIPITDEMLRKPRPENWISFRNGYRSWGFSPLDQITAANVGRLRLVWARTMRDGAQQVEPFVYNGIMFLLQALDVVEALDATT